MPLHTLSFHPGLTVQTEVAHLKTGHVDAVQAQNDNCDLAWILPVLVQIVTEFITAGKSGFVDVTQSA
jgi:hypothetical protein